MQHLPDTAARQTVVYNTAASGANSNVTVAAPSSGWTVIDWIVFGYISDPTNGMLKILEGNTVRLSVPVTFGGAGELTFGDRGFLCTKNTAVTIRLVDGSQTKHLTVMYR